MKDKNGIEIKAGDTIKYHNKTILLRDLLYLGFLKYELWLGEEDFEVLNRPGSGKLCTVNDCQIHKDSV